MSIDSRHAYDRAVEPPDEGRRGPFALVVALAAMTSLILGGIAATAVALRRQEAPAAAVPRLPLRRAVMAALAGSVGIAAAVLARRRLADPMDVGPVSRDAELQGRIDHELLLMGVPAGRFAIDVQDGAVTVRGAPESDEQTRSIEARLETMTGVREVRIDVLPAPATSAV
jgi:osmotically-inducible protein OsmY